MSLTKNVRRWAFYGFANHSYQVVYVAFILPIFFSNFFVRYSIGLSAWGVATGVSTVLGIILALFFGKYADKNNKHTVYAWSIFITAFSMYAMAVASMYSILVLYFLFIITNALFIWSLALYDSILPHVSDTSTVYEYGGFAWGFGYLGGIVSLILALIFQYFFGTYSFIVFLSVPVFYILFSMYSLAGLKNVSFNSENVTQTEQLGKIQSTRESVAPTQALSIQNKIVLFVGYWLISECVTVIGLFAATYLSGEMHFSTLQVGIAFLGLQLIAFPSTWYGGKLARKYNTLYLLGGTILGWGLALTILVFFHLGFVGLGIAIFLMGLVYGNSQSYLRSQYATLIKKSESGFQFGIYSFVSEAAVIVGPIVYGIASDRLHSQKLPLIGLFVLMVTGFYLVWIITRNLKSIKQF